MSGESLQRTLDTAFKVVGNAAGFKFKHYRPDSYIDPLQDRNLLGEIKMAASPDDAFDKNPHEDLDLFKLYVSTKSIELGDIMFSEYLSRTYVVFDKTELRALIGVRCQDEINILRPVMLTGDIKTGFESIATNVPAVATVKGVTSAGGALSAVPRGTLDASATNLEIWTWITPGLIQLNDVIEINDLRYLVMQVDSTSKGTKIKARSTKVGK